ncbi:hypothetical protein, partial [Chryseobacterium sp. CH1]|uniref:hypothetical protein n=1 Tax=Chryseobacterium sp. CH1 TaxID=713551 RepID=UPI0010278420
MKQLDPGNAKFLNSDYVLYGTPAAENSYFKDGINHFITHQTNTINPEKRGTKASFLIDETIGPGECKVFEFRLCP